MCHDPCEHALHCIHVQDSDYVKFIPAEPIAHPFPVFPVPICRYQVRSLQLTRLFFWVQTTQTQGLDHICTCLLYVAYLCYDMFLDIIDTLGILLLRVEACSHRRLWWHRLLLTMRGCFTLFLSVICYIMRRLPYLVGQRLFILRV